MQPAETHAPLTSLEHARVQLCSQGEYIVILNGAPLQAKRALGCVVRPEPGDLVLVSHTPGASYILSVLERPDEANRPTNLAFTGEVNLLCEEGALNIVAQQSVSLASETLSLHANTGDVNIDELSFLGRLFHARLENIRAVARNCETIIDTAAQRFKELFRTVEEHEESQAGSARFVVDETLTVHSKNEVRAAQEHVKIDAEQIHLG